MQHFSSLPASQWLTLHHHLSWESSLVSVRWTAPTGWKMLKTDSAEHIIPNVKTRLVDRGSIQMRLWTCQDWLWQNGHLDRFYHWLLHWKWCTQLHMLKVWKQNMQASKIPTTTVEDNLVWTFEEAFRRAESEARKRWRIRLTRPIGSGTYARELCRGEQVLILAKILPYNPLLEHSLYPKCFPLILSSES